MEVSKRLIDNSQHIQGMIQWPYRSVGVALEVIPRILAQNCGANVVRTLTKLRAKHANLGCCTWGINGHSGVITDMKKLGVCEPFIVKIQTLKTAIESACMLIRIDDIISGISKRNKSE